MGLVDRFLNNTTMYRLVVYVIGGLLVAAFILGGLHVLPFSPWMLAFETAFITAVCVLANAAFAKAFDAPVNVESLYISALILTLIITPPASLHDTHFFEFAVWASLWAMASKFILAIGRKHLFNPAAFAVVLTALTLNQSASWWVGTLPMLPFVAIGGFLITRKILRADLVLSFLAVSLALTIAPYLTTPARWPAIVWRVVASTPLIFFATVMLTEPLTTPPTRRLRLGYGALTGVLYAPWVHIGAIFSTPELALVVSNIFSYLVSPKQKLLLQLTRIVPIGTDTYDFWFTSKARLHFQPGQYMEWTLPHERPDNRGNRRYFTIASSPTEREIGIGVKVSPQSSSSFKKRLLEMRRGDVIVASQLAGDFVMPKDRGEKLAFIAGGIGVTPFRSMVQSLVDRKQRRDIVVLYSNRFVEEVAYADVFAAATGVGVRTVHVLTDRSAAPRGWRGETGRVDEAMIARQIPDYAERRFFLSGPHAMVTAFEQVLQRMGVSRAQITIDFFPGFA
jgi:ferredoxin-NADP reductase